MQTKPKSPQRVDAAFEKARRMIGNRTSQDVARRASKYLREGNFCGSVGYLSALAFDLKRREPERRSMSLAVVLHALGSAHMSFRWRSLTVSSCETEDFKTCAHGNEHLSAAHEAFRESLRIAKTERLPAAACCRVAIDLAGTYMCVANFRPATDLLSPLLESPLSAAKEELFEKLDRDDRSLLPLEKRTRSPRTIVALAVTDRWDAAILMATCLRHLGLIEKSAVVWHRLAEVLPPPTAATRSDDARQHHATTAPAAAHPLFPSLSSVSRGHVDSFAVRCGWNRAEALFQLGRTFESGRGADASSSAAGHATHAFDQSRRAFESATMVGIDKERPTKRTTLRNVVGGGGTSAARAFRDLTPSWRQDVQTWLARCRLYVSSQLPHLASDAFSQTIRLRREPRKGANNATRTKESLEDWITLSRLLLCGGLVRQARMAALATWSCSQPRRLRRSGTIFSALVDAKKWAGSAEAIQRVWRGRCGRVRAIAIQKTARREQRRVPETGRNEYANETRRKCEEEKKSENFAALAGLSTSTSEGATHTSKKRWDWSQRLVRSTGSFVRGLREAVRDARDKLAGPSVGVMVMEMEEDENFEAGLLRDLRARRQGTGDI